MLNSETSANLNVRNIKRNFLTKKRDTLKIRKMLSGKRDLNNMSK